MYLPNSLVTFWNLNIQWKDEVIGQLNLGLPLFRLSVALIMLHPLSQPGLHREYQGHGLLPIKRYKPAAYICEALSLGTGSREEAA